MQQNDKAQIDKTELKEEDRASFLEAYRSLCKQHQIFIRCYGDTFLNKETKGGEDIDESIDSIWDSIVK